MDDHGADDDVMTMMILKTATCRNRAGARDMLDCFGVVLAVFNSVPVTPTNPRSHASARLYSQTPTLTAAATTPLLRLLLR